MQGEGQRPGLQPRSSTSSAVCLMTPVPIMVNPLLFAK